MRVTVNGSAVDLPNGSTVADVVARLTSETDGVAVARNEAVVPRGDWPVTTLGPSDRIEVLGAYQGG